MAAAFKNARKFLGGWLRLITIGGGKAAWIAKVITIIISIAAATNATIRASLLREDGMPFDWVPSWITVGALIVFAVFLVWISVAFGVTWVRFVSLKIETELECDLGRQFYRLPVTNCGWVDTEFKAFAVAIADANREIPNPRLPIELNWMHQRDERHKMSKGITYKADVFGVTEVSGHGTTWICFLAFTGANNIAVDVGTISSVEKNKLWIAVSVENCEDKKWFSIEAGDTTFKLKVVAENPPFLESKRGWLIRAAIAVGLDEFPTALSEAWAIFRARMTKPTSNKPATGKHPAP